MSQHRKESARNVSPSPAVLSDSSHMSLACYMLRTAPDKAAVLSPGAS